MPIFSKYQFRFTVLDKTTNGSHDSSQLLSRHGTVSIVACCVHISVMTWLLLLWTLSNIINICLKFSKSSFEIDEARFPFAEFFAHLSQLAHLRQGGGASPGLGLLITKVLHIGHFFPLVAMVSCLLWLWLLPETGISWWHLCPFVFITLHKSRENKLYGISDSAVTITTVQGHWY